LKGFPQILLLLAAVAAPARGTVYYVDRTGGQDTNSGTSAAEAWQSLARVRQTRYAAGDYILLKRGEVWRESLVIAASGVDGAPITYGGYGSGNPPAIEGDGVALAPQSGLVALANRSNIVLDGLEVRDSSRDGINLYLANGITIRNTVIHDNQYNGINWYDGGNLTIDNCEIYGNSLDLGASYAGIRVDGSGTPQSGFTIINSRIHHNLGGSDWNSGNGIYIGHTGANIPSLRGLLIAGNEIHHNGNPNQNQSGRGISGSFNGDVTITRNYVHRNASAGIYLGDEGLTLKISLAQNVFVDNALRQFGGFTDGSAVAKENMLYVDDPEITGMGVEIGGKGSWVIQNNLFSFTTPTTDTYRSFIRINDTFQDSQLISDYNVFYSAGPNRWKRSDGIQLPFNTWRAAGYDLHSVNPR
jgi:hypothetical protein